MSLEDAYIRLKRTAKARNMRKKLHEELALHRRLALKEAEMRKVRPSRRCLRLVPGCEGAGN
jgi:hypothetical protein